MFEKIKRIIEVNKKLHKDNLLQLKELEWAHVYHDSIRGKEWLEKTPLNIGRWAGNYAFFYILNRILNDFKPNNILEFGLGESSKFVSVFLENMLLHSNHLIIEQDNKWHENFNLNFKLSNRSIVKVCPLVKDIIETFEVNCYEDLDKIITQKFDLYIIDGPFGSEHFSRYDIVNLAQNFTNTDEFVIIIDDYNRSGEKETARALINVLKQKQIPIFTGEYYGNKSVFVIGTEKFKNVQSL